MNVVQEFEVPIEWTHEKLTEMVEESSQTYAGMPSIPFRYSGLGKVRSWDVRAQMPNLFKLSYP